MPTAAQPLVAVPSVAGIAVGSFFVGIGLTLIACCVKTRYCSHAADQEKDDSHQNKCPVQSSEPGVSVASDDDISSQDSPPGQFLPVALNVPLDTSNGKTDQVPMAMVAV